MVPDLLLQLQLLAGPATSSAATEERLLST